jgi:PhnB protein
MVKPIPDGFHTVTPHLVVKGASEAIDFYRRAFGAEEVFRFETPAGGVAHAEIRVGDSRVMLAEECPEMGGRGPLAIGGTPVTLALYVKDVDRAFAQAVAAGATVRMPVADMFWGDRYGQVIDPFGNVWSLATHVKDVTPAEMAKAMAQMCGN